MSGDGGDVPRVSAPGGTVGRREKRLLPIYKGATVDQELLDGLAGREIDMLIELAQGHSIGNQTRYKLVRKRLIEVGLLSMRFGNYGLSFAGQDVAAVLQRMNGKNVVNS